MENAYKTSLKSLVLVMSLTFVTLSNVYAETEFSEASAQIQKIISDGEEPLGIVFEIETLDPFALQKITLYVVKQVKRIKQVYPDVDIAVISHGVEEYALTTKASSEYATTQRLLNEMVIQQEVSLHVCGAVAGLKGLEQEDFPNFISYSASGLAQLNDYKALDYTVVVIKALNNQQRKALFEHKEK